MNRMTRILALAAFAGLGLGATAYTAPAQAREVVVVTTRVAPPPPRFERVPPPRAGYAGHPATGVGTARASLDRWLLGTRPPWLSWAAPRWEHRGPGWYYNRGGWVR